MPLQPGRLLPLVLFVLWINFPLPITLGAEKGDRPVEATVARVDLYGDPLPTGSLGRLGTVRLRHSGEVSSVAISPDGKLVASPGSVWDATTGEEVSRFRGKIGGPAVAFAPDGKTLRTGNQLGDVSHWDVRTGTLLHSYKRETENRFIGQQVTFSPDRNMLVLSDQTSTLCLLDVASDRRLLLLKKEQAIYAHALSHDGNVLATGGSDGMIRLWDVATGQQVRQLPKQAAQIYGLVFAPDGKALASLTWKDLRLWDAATGNLLRTLSPGVGRMTFSPDGKLLANGAFETIRLWDVATGKEVRRLQGHASSFIYDLTFSADGRQLASAGRDHTVILWDVATGKRLHPFCGHQAPVRSLAFAPDGATLASGGDDDGWALVWDLKSQKVRHVFSSHNRGAYCLAFSPDGTVLATGEGTRESGDPAVPRGQVRLWDAATGRLRRQFAGHQGVVQNLAFSPNGGLLASSGWNSVRLWNPTMATLQNEIKVSGQLYQTVCFAPDGKSLLVAEPHQQGLALYDKDTGAKLRDLSPKGEGPWIVCAGFCGGGQTVWALCRVGDTRQPQWRTWDVASGRLRRSFAVSASFSPHVPCALSPDGKLLAVCADPHRDAGGHDIRLYDVEAGEAVVRLRGHSGFVTALSFSPDGKVLASGSYDTTVLLWNAPRARLLGLWARLAGRSKEATNAAKVLKAEPVVSVPFLRERLEEAMKREGAYLRLIADLDSRSFQDRERAYRSLAAAGEAAELALRLALQQPKSLESERRLRALLDRLVVPRQDEATLLVGQLHHGGANPAWARLRELGRDAEPALRRALEQPPLDRPQDGPPRLSFMVRRSIEQLLTQPADPDASLIAPTPELVVRSLAVLGEMDHGQARDLLRHLADGSAESAISRLARATLKQGRGQQQVP